MTSWVFSSRHAASVLLFLCASLSYDHVWRRDASVSPFAWNKRRDYLIFFKCLLNENGSSAVASKFPIVLKCFCTWTSEIMRKHRPGEGISRPRSRNFTIYVQYILDFEHCGVVKCVTSYKRGICCQSADAGNPNHKRFFCLSIDEHSLTMYFLYMTTSPLHL